MGKIILTADELNMIQALRKSKVQSKDAANASGNNGSNNVDQLAGEQKESSARRHYKVDPMQQLNTQILRKFKSLPSDLQSRDTKVSCIDMVLASRKEKCGDPARFYAWILNQASLVKRTFDFEAVCESNGLKGCEQAVAEHLVLEGKAECNNIRLNGLAAYTGNIKMYRDLLVPEFYRFDSTAQSNDAKKQDTHE